MGTTPVRELDFTLTTVNAESPRLARFAVLAFAREHGVSQATLDDVALCVTEAVANVVVHAYRDADGQGGATIEMAVDGPALSVRVCDHGSGLTPRFDSPGLGMGLPLIAQLSSESEFRTRPHGGTEISMRFDLA